MKKEKIQAYKFRFQEFVTSDKGKRFFNFAYSIGAAIVILGALFKILHLAGGNFMLSLGMGIEVLMFILTAFDAPAKEYKWEEVFPVLKSEDPNDRPEFKGGGGGGFSGTMPIGVNTGASNAEGVAINAEGGGALGGGTIIIGGSNVPYVSPEDAKRTAGIPSDINLDENDTQSLSQSIQKLSSAADQLSKMAELTSATQTYLEQLSAISNQMEQFKRATESLTQVSNVLLESYRDITDNSDNITSHSQGYVTQMEDLNRNLAGLNTIYEIQLKSISSQLDNIDRVNIGLRTIRDMYESSVDDSSRYCKETERMTTYMSQLNSVYENMLAAMTVNMYNNPMAALGKQTPKRKNEEENNNNDEA
ncbi:MAG: gliding motility protein GldL [Bacteroidales bacterium]|nr:gliding motility protein GldL [Bacteroidales bacterium]MBQ7818117.1 gliding motility protein GldL [Bacteroidales bacterium]